MLSTNDYLILNLLLLFDTSFDRYSYRSFSWCVMFSTPFIISYFHIADIKDTLIHTHWNTSRYQNRTSTITCDDDD